MQMITAAFWWKGCSASVNQDSISLQHVRLPKGDALLAVVCDGIGGFSKGEEASSIAVCHMTQWFYRECRELISEHKSKELILLALQRQVYQIQELLLRFQQKENITSGTTMTCLLIIKRRYFVAHIGDGSLYLLKRKGLLSAIFGRKADVTCLTEKDLDAEGHLTKCLGVRGNDRAFYDIGRISGRCAFLMGTDGIWHGMDGKRLGRMFGGMWDGGTGGEAALRRRLEMLAEQSSGHGSLDNMTAAAVLFG